MKIPEAAKEIMRELGIDPIRGNTKITQGGGKPAALLAG